jgi:hypothetical protein
MSQKLLFILFFLASSIYAKESITDEQVRQLIIQQSIAQYPGNCPCPYNFASNGSHCGRRSAYSKPGGYSPICYANDVTQQMIDNYKRRN